MILLTDHLDRSNKMLLRASTGTLIDWTGYEDHAQLRRDVVLPSLPDVVYVQFDKKDDNDTDWTLDGMSAPQVYPVVPIKSGWSFGKSGRMKNRMEVTRRQLPLAPGYARTAFSVQGMTLARAVINICFSALASGKE